MGWVKIDYPRIVNLEFRRRTPKAPPPP
eukprot:SAG25_NODE_7481_length_477_cov_0.910290_1_plen_27_part_01